ncbi:MULTISPECIES: response regulator transcription factor [Planktothricoides]|uniref:Response regulator n=2 Tax=Planktothricoides raciborskii TaxID=132608 RepID=A0AAU8JIA0_9CYAN|nr:MULTISPECIES: response regulator [Planktothricoides]KOR34096.1 LuxR family transcriptional regulator [Planktothricoides sp. SR001]MBD2547390.1 response regulator [Planktothricoides raciborskii FACHB-1370]MBD2585918.1 response regulator [Planktothricoides raciborskii FACHB-1261]
MKKILIVDDDRTMRITLRRHLENQGYIVADAKSGVEALKSLEAEMPDLIVSDVMMPDMDGFEFCRRLRTTPSGQLIPFIFLSSLGELDDRIEGHEIGGDDYLIKPFEPRELVAKIEAQLERSRRIYSEIIRLMQHMAGGYKNVSSPSVISLSEKMTHPLNNRLDNQSNLTPKEYPVTSSISETSPDRLPLTPAEARVFWEVIQGCTNKEIAERLFISPRTVQTHLRHILSKLDLENRGQLIRFAFEHGYESAPDAE